MTAQMTNATKNLCTNARSDNGEDVMGRSSPYRRDTGIRAHPTRRDYVFGQPTSGLIESPETGT